MSKQPESVEEWQDVALRLAYALSQVLPTNAVEFAGIVNRFGFPKWCEQKPVSVEGAVAADERLRLLMNREDHVRLYTLAMDWVHGERPGLTAS